MHGLITALVLLYFDHNHVNVHQLCSCSWSQEFMESIVVLDKLSQCQLQERLACNKRGKREKHLSV